VIIIQCDGCYKQVSSLDEISAFILREDGVNGQGSKPVHLCTKCKTSRRTLYIDNPYYVEPIEDALSEQKASQSS
jgi:hypothetical protein